MSILIDKGTKAIVQGITGNHGKFHTALMKIYGTKIVAGVTPGKAGEEVHGVPVLNSVKEVLTEHEADWSIIFVPAKFTKSAALEALENNLNTVIITEGMPVHDMLEVVAAARKKKLTVVGPNTPGLISVGKSKLGIIPNNIVKEGKVGIVSRSGTLTYEVVTSLTKHGIGQSTVVGIGGDKIAGTNFIDILKLFEEDDETENIVMIGEIGVNQEENSAEFINENVSKKVIAYIAVLSAPEGKAMGHAGAIIHGNVGTAKSKISSLKDANVKLVKTPYEVYKSF